MMNKKKKKTSGITKIYSWSQILKEVVLADETCRAVEGAEDENHEFSGEVESSIMKHWKMITLRHYTEASAEKMGKHDVLHHFTNRG